MGSSSGKGGGDYVPTVSPSQWSLEEWAYASRNKDVAGELQSGASNYGRPSGHYSRYGKGEGRQWGVSESDYESLYGYRNQMSGGDRKTLESWYAEQHPSRQLPTATATQSGPTAAEIAAQQEQARADAQEAARVKREGELRTQATTIVNEQMAKGESRARAIGSSYRASSPDSAKFTAAVENEFQRLLKLDSGEKVPSKLEPSNERRAAAAAAGRGSTVLTGDGVLAMDDPTLSKKILLGR